MAAFSLPVRPRSINESGRMNYHGAAAHAMVSRYFIARLPD